jgi:predicted nucleic-acid-binding Zn-ribbon protein
MNYLCGVCHEQVSIKVKANKYVSIMCKNCGITIIYPDGFIVSKTKEQFLDWKKQNGTQG